MHLLLEKYNFFFYFYIFQFHEITLKKIKTFTVHNIDETIRSTTPASATNCLPSCKGFSVETARNHVVSNWIQLISKEMTLFPPLLPFFFFLLFSLSLVVSFCVFIGGCAGGVVRRFSRFRYGLINAKLLFNNIFWNEKIFLKKGILEFSN